MSKYYLGYSSNSNSNFLVKYRDCYSAIAIAYCYCYCYCYTTTSGFSGFSAEALRRASRPGSAGRFPCDGPEGMACERGNREACGPGIRQVVLGLDVCAGGEPAIGAGVGVGIEHGLRRMNRALTRAPGRAVRAGGI